MLNSNLCNSCCGSPKLVKPRCKPAQVVYEVLADQDLNVLTDNAGTEFLLKMERTSIVYEFEFNREEQT